MVPTWPGPRFAWAPRSSSQARPLSLGPARRERGLRGASPPGRRPGHSPPAPRPLRGVAHPGPERANVHHPRHPEGNCNSSVFFFSRHFSPTSFLFCLVLEGRVRSRKANTKSSRRWGGGEQGAAQEPGPPRPPRPQPRPPAPFRPPARVARPGGQLLYWHALRPEAGPCRPP